MKRRKIGVISALVGLLAGMTIGIISLLMGSHSLVTDVLAGVTMSIAALILIGGSGFRE